MLSSTTIFVVILIGGVARGQLSDEAQDTLNKLNKEFSDKLPSNFNASDTNATVAQVQDLFKQKCLKNADEEAFNTAMAGKDKLVECMQSLVNVKELEQEINEASPKGELDEAFKKYCDRSPKFKQCFREFTSTVEPCLDAKERSSMKYIHNITESLTDFICYKDGNRIAMFIAEEGPQCLTAHQNDIGECVNKTFGAKVDTNQLSMDNIPELIFEEEQCVSFNHLQECIVSKLDKCPKVTPANIVESLFKFVRQVTPCSSYPLHEASISGGHLMKALSTILLLGLAAHNI